MNISKLKFITDNRTYKIILKGYKVYCPTCNKRCGIFNAYCGPLSYKKKKNWKQYRDKQYKL